MGPQSDRLGFWAQPCGLVLIVAIAGPMGSLSTECAYPAAR